MIPVRIPRAAFILFGASGLLSAVDQLLLVAGLSAVPVHFLTGILTGGMIFLIARVAGWCLQFCGKGLIQDADRLQRVQTAMSSLGPAAESLRVSLVQSDAFMACTVAEGGHHRLFISTHNVDSLTPGALKGVLAHECGHIRHHHPLKVGLILGMLAVIKLTVGVPIMAALATLLAFLYLLRTWEFVADADGVELAGHECVLAALREYQVLTGAKDLPPVMEFLSPYPGTQKRIAAVQASLERPGRACA